ncbi:hypothetical protein [Francisella sp. LA112445]|uniref:hypothetical protein n=1 Tax=Francisella sp. LA112445 TaxID=1395624 RepID=UPI001788D7B2|nr:hypothetical protein [Francisella sp. LA112445]QIW10149.1 hypothetical protein FIP56_05380 [Francisella sp. LA112445]
MNISIIIQQRHKEYIKNNKTSIEKLNIYKNIFDTCELQTLQKYLCWFEALHNREIPAFTEGQNLFIDVANNVKEPITDYEKLYRKYLLANQEHKVCEAISRAFQDHEIEILVENMNVYFAAYNNIVNATTPSLEQFCKACESRNQSIIQCDIAKICFLYWKKYHQRQSLLESETINQDLHIMKQI